MDLQSFFHVALKVDDPDSAAEFYQAHLDADVVERRRAEESDSEMAVDAVVLEVADKLVYLFDQAPYEAAGLVDELPTGFLHFGYIVDDIEDAFGTITADDVEVVMEPARYGDKKIGFFVAPGDIRIELIEYLE
ncbi:VOC family protein [Salinadaptatus halalkaliphilus]|uniref:VOC family protein n=1 Tax=Salinadaptatus halalkaliphilus TaxID=2419781 RepID=A0A4S3TIZ0_9EURY|nr:VOC family protein [Salinadaptatus halalkaliphilus]THE64009.1 VOC family protein [Salinadaptatus halalkaliphilus]